MNNQPDSDVAAGAAAYSKPLLRVYDWFVIGFSNRYVWRCPSPMMLAMYNEHVSANHLDVGVGTGYFLDKCTFPGAQPRIVLMDLNPNSLETTARRLKRYAPVTHIANVFETIEIAGGPFDSIGLNYLLHCLPGDLQSKHVVFGNLKALLNSGGVLFGSTILGQGVQHNMLARRLMKVYNKRGIFSNHQDNLADLQASLEKHFSDYTTRVVGNVAFFSGRA